MLISINRLRRDWGLCPDVIVHAGAHMAEEYQDYVASNWGNLKYPGVKLMKP